MSAIRDSTVSTYGDDAALLRTRNVAGLNGEHASQLVRARPGGGGLPNTSHGTGRFAPCQLDSASPDHGSEYWLIIGQAKAAIPKDQ